MGFLYTYVYIWHKNQGGGWFKSGLARAVYGMSVYVCIYMA